MTGHTEYKINIHFFSGCPSEYLGEEDPEVFGSILGAPKNVVNVIGMTKMTPILKNCREKVLLGRIARR